MKKMGMTTLTLALVLSTLSFGLQAAPPLQAKTPQAVTSSKVTRAAESPNQTKSKIAPGEGDMVSINTATAEDFARVMNGVGLKKGQRIVDYRNELGAFTDVDQLQEVPGIGPALFERNRAHLKL
ncbi:ComEA family DNA-binding protein [Rouxiella sp. Mn2063]|uniref:ComEA family DNA-binding protein n=1 Tax=Rouxiella sp. Mn2063 TaxID=3395262 RepID=UPI003BBDF955